MAVIVIQGPCYYTCREFNILAAN